MGYTLNHISDSAFSGLQKEFSSSAAHQARLKRMFNQRYYPYVPHFDMNGGRSLQNHQGGYYIGNGATAEQFIAPMYDMMAHQQHIIEQQQKSQQEQSSSVLAEQNTLIKEMFSSFESSFKSMLEAMSGMMATNNKLMIESQKVSHPRRRASDTPEIFTKAVPLSQIQPQKAANEPIHVGIDPETGKISRQGAND